MGRQELADLIREGRIESVPPDPAQVAMLREQAARHLVSSHTISETDLAGAFSLAYDAIRKELTALLLDHGFRARSAGSHTATGQAAAVLLPTFDEDGFEWLRTVRIATEYGTDSHGTATAADLQRAWRFAARLTGLLVAPRPSRLGSAPSIRIPPRPDPR
jgi:hypothetical protein